jgi:hypothetical protein
VKLKDLVVFGARVDDEVDELKELKPGVQKIVPGLVKTRIDGVRWKVGVVLEKDEEG